MGGWTAVVYTEEQQARLGIDENGVPFEPTTAAATANASSDASAAAESHMHSVAEMLERETELLLHEHAQTLESENADLEADIAELLSQHEAALAAKDELLHEAGAAYDELVQLREQATEAAELQMELSRLEEASAADALATLEAERDNALAMLSEARTSEGAAIVDGGGGVTAASAIARTHALEDQLAAAQQALARAEAKAEQAQMLQQNYKRDPA
eukprot:UC1_evm1s286